MTQPGSSSQKIPQFSYRVAQRPGVLLSVRKQLPKKLPKTLIFFDCEFTGLEDDADLLSGGFVTQEGQALYFERTDYDPLKLSDYVEENILPLMGEEGASQWPASQCRSELKAWLTQFKNPVLVFDSPWDAHILNRLFSRAGVCKEIPGLSLLLLPANDVGSEVYEDALVSYFENHHGKQHHALHDAMAMREGWQALQTQTLRPRCTPR